MATTNVTITVNSPASTSVTFTASQSSWTAPVAPATVIGSMAVGPAGWGGTLSLSGSNASSFAVAGSDLVVGSTALAAGSYSLTITASP